MAAPLQRQSPYEEEEEETIRQATGVDDSEDKFIEIYIKHESLSNPKTLNICDATGNKRKD